eukprot:scaffold275063_cov18-Tisochrysis_lutea.AAC.1
MKGDFDSCLWRGIAWERGHRFNGLWKSCGTILFREGHVLHSNGAARPYMSAVKWYCMHLQPNDTKHRAWGCSRGLIVGGATQSCSSAELLCCKLAGGRAGPAGAPARAITPLRALLEWAGILLELYLNLLEGVPGQQEPQ